MKYMSVIIMLALSACQGQKGDQGENGTNGQDGTDSASVTIVQFCPGVPHFSTVFPEVGLCIQGSLYAVYSKHDGFLTLLSPGLYRSEAVGSDCTFKVLANCQVKN